MKRVVLVFVMAVLAAALLPGLASATEAAAPTAAATAAVTTAATSTLITLPEAPPLASAEEAKEGVVWIKPGDGLNLIVALISLAAIAGIIVWAIIAQRRVASA
jgi:hypothetical protein